MLDALRTFRPGRFAHAILACVAVFVTVAVTADVSGAVPANPHGRFSEDCSLCHGAKNWKVVQLSPKFDHSKYGFPLEGAHKTPACTSCHASLEFSQQRAQCVTCHKDPHRGEMGTECGRCHGSRSFTDRGPMLRAHQLTRFPLDGRHAVAECEQCHKPAGQGQLQFASTPMECRSCHMDNYKSAKNPDHAASGFPTTCNGCHNAQSWSAATFNHDQSGFPLTGAHKAVACASCHASGNFKAASPACASCHQPDFDHASPNHVSAGFPASQCATCHGTTRWAGAAFDHGTTGFPLTGAHVARACNDCHSDGVYHNKPTACQSCHAAQYGSATIDHQAAGFAASACATCHNTTSFAGATYNHSATAFPLTGTHASRACTDCHGDAVFAAKSVACFDCHGTDYSGAAPAHTAASFPPKACASCHNTTSFATSAFNHSTTGFPLTGAHTTRACNDCHTSGTYAAMSTACISCHTTDYSGATPPHSAAAFPQAQCGTCHTTTTFAGAAFNHNATSFPLTGAHTVTACAGCHSDGVYNNKPTACFSCHATDYAAATPPHSAASFPTAQCATCHSTTAFAGTAFNHSATSFPLTGAHTATACAGCHSDGVYNNKPTACYSCHATDYAGATPAHTAAAFPQAACTSCHNTTAFAGASFNHNATSFPLTGAHVARACNDCHADGVYNGKPTDCYSCHATDYTGATPTHTAAAFPQAACASCHTTTAFAGASFNHNATSFPLTGAHVATACAGCHGDGVYNGKSTACQSCHAQDYSTATPPHNAAAFPTAQCGTCHTTTSFAGASFNHNATSFPLTGAHTLRACNDCHSDGVYNNKPMDCYSCHAANYTGATPTHTAAAFPQAACASCHNTSSFAGASFNHNATSFPLTGAHVATACAGCHGDGVYNGKSTACQSCHQSDYSGASLNHTAAGFLASACATCHNTTTFTNGTFNHTTATSFPLTGAHTARACNDCHGDAVFAAKSTACYSCHATEYAAATPTHTPASFPQAACATCHGTTSFATSTFNHSTTAFPLTGAHTSRACNDCHGDGVYAGKPTACYSCHASDYSGATPPHTATSFPQAQCATCHNTTTFANATFNHNATSFPLTGAHVSRPCTDCHGDGVYAGKSTACYSCHASDYASATPTHTAAAFPQNACATCHNTTSFAGASVDHTALGFPLTGQHANPPRACADCHASGYVATSKECFSCHQSTYTTAVPAHTASFFPTGTSQCITCHAAANTSHNSWANGKFANHTWFPIASGRHSGISCMNCHNSPTNLATYSCAKSCHTSQLNGHPNRSGFNLNTVETQCYVCHSSGSAG